MAERVGELDPQVDRQRVALLGPAQRDDGDVVGVLDRKQARHGRAGSYDGARLSAWPKQGDGEIVEVEVEDARCRSRPARASAGCAPAEAIEPAHVKAPTRGNRKLEALLDGINADPEVRGWWHMAQVNSERLGMSDHSWVHVQIVLNIALRLLRLLVKAGVQPAMVADHAMRDRDAEVVVAAGALLHDVGMSIHRADHEAYSLFLAERKLRELLADVYKDAERTVVVAESLHAIIGHRRRGEPYTVEAGVVRVADALDMAHGRSRAAGRGGPGGHPRDLGGRDRLDRHLRRRGARRADRDRDEQLGRRLPGRRPARDEAARARRSPSTSR